MQNVLMIFKKDQMNGELKTGDIAKIDQMDFFILQEGLKELSSKWNQGKP